MDSKKVEKYRRLKKIKEKIKIKEQETLDLISEISESGVILVPKRILFGMLGSKCPHCDSRLRIILKKEYPCCDYRHYCCQKCDYEYCEKIEHFPDA